MLARWTCHGLRPVGWAHWGEQCIVLCAAVKALCAVQAHWCVRWDPQLWISFSVARLRQHVEDAKGVEGQKPRKSFVVTPAMIRVKDPGGQEKCVGPQGLWTRPWFGGLLLLLLTLLPCKPQASPARCPPPLPTLLRYTDPINPEYSFAVWINCVWNSQQNLDRLNGHPYLEKQHKGLMVKKEVTPKIWLKV